MWRRGPSAFNCGGLKSCPLRKVEKIPCLYTDADSGLNIKPRQLPFLPRDLADTCLYVS